MTDRAANQRSCASCGCTQNRACFDAHGPCAWDMRTPELCTACSARGGRYFHARSRAAHAILAAHLDARKAAMSAAKKYAASFAVRLGSAVGRKIKTAGIRIVYDGVELATTGWSGRIEAIGVPDAFGADCLPGWRNLAGRRTKMTMFMPGPAAAAEIARLPAAPGARELGKALGYRFSSGNRMVDGPVPALLGKRGVLWIPAAASVRGPQVEDWKLARRLARWQPPDGFVEIEPVATAERKAA